MNSKSAYIVVLCFMTTLGAGQGHIREIASRPLDIDPDAIINDSYNLLKEREPSMTAAEHAIYEKVIPMVFEQPDFAINLLEAIQEEDETASAAFKLVLGNVYFSQDRIEQAEALYREGIDEYPDFLRAWENLGALYYAQERYREAIPCLTKSIELGGRSPRIHGLLGYCLNKIGNSVAAEHTYLQALAAEPTNPQWMSALIELYLQTRQYPRAAILVQQMLAQKPDDPSLWTLYSSIFKAQDMATEAIAVLEVADSLDFASADGLLFLGDLYAEINASEDAVRIYGRASDLFPDQANDRALDYALALIEERSLEQAANLLGNLNSSERPAMKEKRLYARARLAFAQNEPDNALEHLNRLLEIAPLDGKALLLLGQIHEATDNPDKAAFAYEQATADDQVRFDALIQLSRLAIADGDFNAGIERLKAANDLRSSQSLREYLAKIKTLANIENEY